MRGKSKSWGKPTTLSIVYKPSKKQWYASFTVNIVNAEAKYGSLSNLKYDSMVAFDLGTTTAITCYDGERFKEITNPRFTQVAEKKIKQQSKALRRKRAPNRKKKIKASRDWKKAQKKVSKLKNKAANQRSNWQHQVTSDIASRHDIGVTEKLNTKGMTGKAKKRCDPASSNDARASVRFNRERAPRQGSKRKKLKAGLNKSILSVGFGTLNQMIAYKIEAKGGILISVNTRKVKPSQRCPNCGTVHKDWAKLSNQLRHICCFK